MGYRAGLLILALLAPSGYSQQWFVQGTPNVQRDAPRHTITGTVSNALTGEPIRRALVRLLGQRTAIVLTGFDGRFEIADVPEGPINLSATKPGFFDPQSIRDAHTDSALPGWWQNTPPQIVGSGSNDFRLALVPAGRIIGQITDADGEPVEQIQVQVLVEQIQNGHKQWQQRNSTITDEDGQYRIDDLAPGRYLVYAMGHVLPALSSNAPPQVTAPLYYPDARDRAAAEGVEIRPGQDFRADFHLRPERGFRVTGTLSGYSAQLGVSVSILDDSGRNILFGGMNVDQNRGRFSVEAVPSGTWTLFVITRDREGHSYQARQDIAVSGADISNLQLVLHPAASIPVVINHAADQSMLTQPPANAGVNAALMSADFQQYGTVGHPEQQAALFIDNVPEGKYKLSVQMFGRECLESAWYGNIDLLRDYLVVASGGAANPIVINMRSDCSTLDAKIAPANDQTSGFLVVVSASSISEPRTAPIGMANRAQMGVTLSPGTYQIYGFTTLDDLEYANPEALRDYPSQSITLDPGQKLELTVKLTEPKGQ